MDKALKVIRELQNSGLIRAYAIGGGIAATYYIEPILTYDLDIFFIPRTEALDLLSPIYGELKKRGHSLEKELVIIEGIPVQFIPVYNDLVKEAVETARESTYKRIKTRILRPEYLLAIALQTNRPKDRERAIQLLSQAKLDSKLLTRVLKDYGLGERYRKLKV
ncbi:MAG: hypothetical protein A2V45_04660 [Candidatus Aminicenantes bacterium RBG_19FT_COMBO_58_17]|nr:MAG: hypothetical protein A2V45_04660 [Candidatus Aminicenantes bacterium RBG_19FT_COMBO_58_17]